MMLMDDDDDDDDDDDVDDIKHQLLYSCPLGPSCVKTVPINTVHKNSSYGTKCTARNY